MKARTIFVGMLSAWGWYCLLSDSWIAAGIAFGNAAIVETYYTMKGR